MTSITERTAALTTRKQHNNNNNNSNNIKLRKISQRRGIPYMFENVFCSSVNSNWRQFRKKRFTKAKNVKKTQPKSNFSKILCPKP
jgi:hypothetical protein